MTVLRIAHVVRRLVFEEWGGTETVVWNTACRQLQTGLEPEILATAALSRPGTEVCAGIPVHRFRYRYPYFPMTGAAAAALDRKGGNPCSQELERALLNGRYDIVHIHCGGHLAAAAGHAAHRLGIPSVLTLHGGAGVIPPEELAEMLRPLRHKFHYGRLIDLCRRIPRDPLCAADYLICLSRAEKEHLALKYPGKQIFLLPNGIDVDRFRQEVPLPLREQARFGIPAQRRIILCISRIDYQKNQLALLDLLPQTADTHLLLIGPVTAGWYHNAILERVRKLGLEGRVTIVPGLPPSSPLLPAALRNAYAFILPSRHEPFGIAALEAWAAGVPLLAAATGGLRDIVQDGENGLLFAHDSPAQLLDAWRRLESSERLRRHLVTRAGEAVEQYRWPRIVERLQDIYRSASAAAAE